MYKNILLAIDGSEYANRAAKYAVELAKMNSKSSIEMVCVIDHNREKSDVFNNPTRKAQLQETEQMVKDARVNYEMVFLQGDPSLKIINHANEQEFDIVIIGNRGLNRLQEFVLGSVSHKVAKRANCPVLIVK